MTTLVSRSGAQALTITAEPGARYATIHLEHVDGFDDHEDSTTVGEFLAHDIIAALVPPLPASRHIAAEPLRRRHWRRK